MTIHGESPYQVMGAEQNYKRLFYSDPDKALMREVTLQAGYGVLRAGTPLAKNVSAAGGVGKYVPYAQTTPDSSLEEQKSAFLVQDASGSDLYVTMDDSYKFAVGDDIIIYDTGNATTAAENLGAITAIDRTTYKHMAKITVTTGISGAFTVDESAAIHVECGADNTNGWSDCAGILASSVDTGTGVNAQGALAPIVLSNTILYEGSCEGIDAAAKTDISGTSNGNLLIIK